MIQLLITVMLAAIIVPLAYFQFKAIPLPKKMVVAGTIIAAALIAALLQFLELAFYVPFLAIVAVSMAGAIAYAKIDENEKAEKRRISEERKQKRQKSVVADSSSIEETQPAAQETSLYDEPEEEEKSFAMQTIGANGEER